jgi:hypothetical protein
MINSLYTVTITPLAAASPRDGFIDSQSMSQYIAGGATAPTTLAQGEAKARANMRYTMLCQQLQLNANIYMEEVVGAGGNCTTAPTSFVFIANVERGDSVLTTADELNAGVFLTGAAALERLVARALIGSRTTNLSVYDGTLTAAPGNAGTADRIGARVETVTIGQATTTIQLAEAAITVVKIY